MRNHGAYILARYSTDNQEQDSIEVQVERCAGWCEKENIPVLEVFADYAVSGMKDSRPQYNRMMSLLTAGLADTVVIYDQSRMFRKMTAWFQFRDELERLGVRVVSVTQPMIGGDLSDPSNFLVEGSMALFNQMWVLQTRQKVIEKMRYMARNGEFTGGVPAYGYRVAEGALEVEPDEAATVKRIYELYAGGSSYREITDALTRDGIRTRRGNPFGATTLHDLLRNKKYIGTIVYGKTVKNHDGSRNTHGAREDAIEIPGGCPAIVSTELFEAVQKRLELRKRSGGRPPTRTEYALRGKVFCGECKSPANLHYSGRGQKYAYYECTAQKRTHICESKPIKAAQLESLVASSVRSILAKPEQTGRLITILRQQRDALLSGAGERLGALVKRRGAVAGMLDNATEAVLNGMSSPALRDKVHTLEAERASLDYQITQLKQDVTAAQMSDGDIRSAIEQLVASVETDDAAVLAVVYRVEVYADRIVVWTILECHPDGTVAKASGHIKLPEIASNSTDALSGTRSEQAVFRLLRLIIVTKTQGKKDASDIGSLRTSRQTGAGIP